MANDLRIPKLYKTLLMLALVFGPFYWLAFTEDGQWRTDLALLFVLGKPDFNLALDSLTSAVTESRIRETFPKLALQCAEGTNPFGNRLCAGALGAFNGIPSSSLTLFLAGEELRAVKVSYRRAYHERMRDWVEDRVGEPLDSETILSMPVSEEGVATWTVTDGWLLMRDGVLGREEEPALMWLSRAALAR